MSVSVSRCRNTFDEQKLSMCSAVYVESCSYSFFACQQVASVSRV